MQKTQIDIGQLGVRSASERFAGIGKAVDVRHVHAGEAQAVIDGEMWERAVVLDAAEALFLGGRNELTVADEGRG